MRAHAALLVLFVSPTIVGAQGADLARVAPGPAEPGSLFCRAVIDSFASPGFAPMGLDWVEDEGVLYHVDEARGAVYSITPDGTADSLFCVASQVGLPNAGGNGICHVSRGGGTFLYVTDWNGADWQNPVDMVYKFTPDGTLVDSFDVDGFADGVLGICFGGTNFWLSAEGEQAVIKCDTLFHETARYDHPGLSGGGMDFDPETGRYYLTDYGSGTIYVCDASMLVADVFASPSSGVGGVTIGRTSRGRSLWCSSWTSDLIYEIDDAYFNSPVRNTTWGALKAMFLWGH
jgi:hypothetical protein